MQLEFYGAAGRVTGSCHILRVGKHQILLDCGLIQGSPEEEELNREPFPFDPKAIDAVVLSHAHIDHTGRLPLLCQRGFAGPIYTHYASQALTEVLLDDAAGLYERDAEYENRKRQQKNWSLIEPLYRQQDVAAVIKNIAGLHYQERREILPGITIQFSDAGHILGSALVELWLQEGGDQQRKLVFSGDLGQYNTPILRDPVTVEDADVVLMESTYGNRSHRSRAATIAEIGEIIGSAHISKGNILIPAFAIGRTQEILYLFGKYYEEWSLARWRIFIDSPMAIAASKIYWDYPHLYDEEASTLRRGLDEMPRLKNVYFTESVEESRALNRVEGGAIIIAGSGMCNGGRILHHLKHNVWRARCHVLIVGYQAKGTLGRRLVDREPSVRIHGDAYPVRATIHTVGGLSAHGDQNDLLRWVGGFKTRPPVYLVHGEPQAAAAFRDKLRAELGNAAQAAQAGQMVDLGAL